MSPDIAAQWAITTFLWLLVLGVAGVLIWFAISAWRDLRRTS